MFSQECCRGAIQTFHTDVPSAAYVLGPLLDAGEIVGNQVDPIACYVAFSVVGKQIG